MKTRLVVALMLVSLATLSACDRDAMMSSKGFRLPDGDVEAGREAFLYMQCHQCHTIEGVELPVIPGQDRPYVELGGKVTYVKTYGQLVTAIINPSHELARGYAEEVVAENGESKRVQMDTINPFPLLSAPRRKVFGNVCEGETDDSQYSRSSKTQRDPPSVRLGGFTIFQRG